MLYLHNMLEVILNVLLHFVLEFLFTVLWLPENLLSYFPVHILSHPGGGRRESTYSFIQTNHVTPSFWILIFLSSNRSNLWLIGALNGIYRCFQHHKQYMSLTTIQEAPWEVEISLPNFLIHVLDKKKKKKKTTVNIGWRELIISW